MLNKKKASSKGHYFFDKPIPPAENLKKELILNPNIRDSISSLRKEVWVYDYNFNLVNGLPFKTQQEMLKNLNLKRVRTINKYKDTGTLFKDYYFFSNEISLEVKNRLINERLSSPVRVLRILRILPRPPWGAGGSFAKPTKNSKLTWVYNISNNNLVNNKPFTSMTSAANF